MRKWVTAGFLVMALIFAGAIVTTALSTNSVLHQTRSEQCKQVDADHNRERARIIANEKALYLFPEFKALVASPKAEQFAYEKARKDYNDVRTTRPVYCDMYHKNPVEPFPSLKEIKQARGVTSD